MKSKILLSILASSFFMGTAIAEHHGGDMDKVTFSGATAELVIPKIHLVDDSDTTLSVMMGKLKLIKAEQPYELEVTTLEAVDEATAGDHDGHGRAKFSTSTNVLMLPEVHVLDASGMMTEMVAAKLELMGFTPPFTLKVTSLGPAVDSRGCIWPETWHEPMNHCMDQTSANDKPEDKMPEEGDKDSFGCVYPKTWHAAMGHCMDQRNSKK